MYVSLKIILCIIVMDCIKWLFMHIGHNWLIFYYTKSVVQYFLNNEDVKSRQISKAMTTDNNLDSRTSRKSFSGIFSYEFNDLKFHWFVISVKYFTYRQWSLNHFSVNVKLLLFIIQTAIYILHQINDGLQIEYVLSLRDQIVQ